jgi:hypothetical protein
MDLQRPPRSAVEIAALPAFGTAAFESYVHARGKEFEPETLVYILRESITASDTSLFNHCGRLLIGDRDEGGRWSGRHCEPIIMTVATDFGFCHNEALLREFRTEVYGEIWRAIYADRSAKHFWEERFGLALKYKCIDVARRLNRQRQREQRHERRQLEWESETLAEEQDQKRVEDDVLERIDERVLLRAIRKLPPRQSRAAFLVWVEGRPVEGEDDGSAAKVLDVTPRGVYKLLANAKTTLTSDPVIRTMLDDAS